MQFRLLVSVNSRLQVLGGENTYLGGKFDAFLNVFCILGVFLERGWNFRFWGGGGSQEIAGNNTDY